MLDLVWLWSSVRLREKLGAHKLSTVLVSVISLSSMKQTKIGTEHVHLFWYRAWDMVVVIISLFVTHLLSIPSDPFEIFLLFYPLWALVHRWPPGHARKWQNKRNGLIYIKRDLYFKVFCKEIGSVRKKTRKKLLVIFTTVDTRGYLADQ